MQIDNTSNYKLPLIRSVMNSIPPNRAGIIVGEDKNVSAFNMSMNAEYSATENMKNKTFQKSTKGHSLGRGDISPMNLNNSFNMN